MISRGDAKARVAVENSGVIGRNGHVRQQRDRKPGADRAAANRGYHRLGTIDQVVDEVAGLLPDADQRGLVGDHALDHAEIAAR